MPLPEPSSFSALKSTPGASTIYVVDPHGNVANIGSVAVDNFDPNSLAALIQAIISATPQIFALIQTIIAIFKPTPDPTPNPRPGPNPPGPFFPPSAIGTTR